MLFNRTTEGGQEKTRNQYIIPISRIVCLKTTKNPKNPMKSDKKIIFKKTSKKITQLIELALDFKKGLHYIVLL